MAGEGLFFTGTVLKNNRNLLEEEAARQQLEMQREELELKKQAAADKRKEARKNNTPKALDFNTSSMGPDMGPVLQSKALDYQKAVNANSLNEEGGDLEAMNSRSNSESKLKVDTNIFNEVWKDVSANRTLSRGANRGNLRTNTEGGYTFENSYQSFLEDIETMSSEDAYKLYSEREGDINESKWENPISASYKDGVMLKPTNRTDGSAYEEYTGFSAVTKNLEEKLTPDKNGNWNDPAYKKLYTGQEGLISVEGSESRLSYPAAFAFETKGIGLEADDTTFTDKLSPKNEAYEPELAAEYIQWIKKRSEDTARKDFPKRETKGKTVSDSDKKAEEIKKAQYDSDIKYTNLMKSAEIGDSDSSGYPTYNNSGITQSLQTKTSSFITAEISHGNILGKGSPEVEAFLTAAENSVKGSTDTTVEIISITLDGNGTPVVLVKSKGAGDHKVYVPYSTLSSSTLESTGVDVSHIVNYKQPEKTTTAADY